MEFCENSKIGLNKNSANSKTCPEDNNAISDMKI